MSLDKSDVEKIASLSRLSLTESEISGLGDELSNILDLVEQMNSVNTSSVSPLAHPLEINARLRADEVTEKNQRDHFQSIAPEIEQCHYLVPKVIE